MLSPLYTWNETTARTMDLHSKTDTLKSSLETLNAWCTIASELMYHQAHHDTHGAMIENALITLQELYDYNEDAFPDVNLLAYYVHVIWSPTPKHIGRALETLCQHFER